MTHTTQILDDRIHELLQRIPTELFIAGQFQPAYNGATLSVTNPSDGSELATVASASEKEARAALDAAEKAQPTWAATPARERSEILRRAYDLVIEHKDDLALIQSLDVMSRDVVESVEGYAANRRVVSVVVVEVEPAGQRQASFGL